MKVYLTGARAKQSAHHVLFIAPAADIDGEAPSEWLDETRQPKTIPVAFAYGVAEVPGNVGEYMISRGLAAKTALILPDGVKVA